MSLLEPGIRVLNVTMETPAVLSRLCWLRILVTLLDGVVLLFVHLTKIAIATHHHHVYYTLMTMHALIRAFLL